MAEGIYSESIMPVDNELKIMSLQEPTKKMSKSCTNIKNTIYFHDLMKTLIVLLDFLAGF